MAWVIALSFVVCAWLMYHKVLSALLALPLMALVIALAAQPGEPLAALSLVFGKGTTRLAGAMSNAVFGAVLAQVVAVSGVAEAIVRRAAELAGDRPVSVSLVMIIATAVAFTAISGLGAAIMVGSIVLPILVGVGLAPVAAVGMFLFGVSLGGAWNVSNWGMFRDLLGLENGIIMQLSLACTVPLALATLAYVLRESRRARAAFAQVPPTGAVPAVGPAALFTPLLPIGLVLGAKLAGVELEINAALALAILYGVVATRPRDMTQSLSAAIVEGIRAVAPVLWLMMGIGMVVTVLMADNVTGAVGPLLARAVPHGAVSYVLVFGLLSPLALYRGPLNLYGMGAGLGAMLKAALGGPLVGGALMGSGLVQGVCDPTNTHNTWAAGFAGCDVNDVLRSTLSYAWAANVVALVWIQVAHG